MDHIHDGIRRPVATLSRENWRIWFKEFEHWLIGENIDFAITQSLFEYAGIKTPDSTSPTSTNTNVEEVTRGFAKLGIDTKADDDRLYNADKYQKHRAADAKVQFMLSKCIGEFDRQHINAYSNAKDQWNALKAKYEKTTSVARREDLQQITGFKFGMRNGKSVEMTIQTAWTYLVSIRGKIAIADPKLASTFDLSTLFEYLLAGLPESFNVIQQSFEGNTTADVYEKLEILERSERKYDLSAKVESSESAHPAYTGSKDLARPAGEMHSSSYKSKGHKDKGRRYGSSKIQCHFCEQEHYRNKCELREHLMFTMSEFRLSKARKEKQSQKHSSTKSSSKAKHEKGLTADTSTPSSTASSTPSSESDPEPTGSGSSEDEEVCHFSKDKTPCKIPKSDWCSDSGCTTHMTDEPGLFRGALIPINRRTVRVGGGKLYADFIGQVEMRVDGVSLLLDNVLYVPGLGVNLLSSRKLCLDWKCLGVFNDKSMWFISEKKQVVLQANVKEGLYIVSRIIPGAQGIESAMISMLEGMNNTKESFGSNSMYDATTEDLCCHSALASDDTDVYMHNDNTPGMKRLTRNENLARYKLMHRRFAHLGPEKIRNLHKVTTLKRPVMVPTDQEMCRVCKITKLRNRTSKTLSPWKESILALVSMDVAGPFLSTVRGNRYFAQVVDNATRKTWSYVDKTKSGLMIQIRKWKTTEETRTQLKLGAVRSDNAAEIRELLDEWSKEGVIEEPTTTYTGSHQNGIAKRSIQQAETDARSMLKDADLPLEFWDWAVETDTYIRNRTSGGPLIDGVHISPEEAYVGERPSIDHIRVFGSVCYSYVSPKSMPAGTTSKKLLDTGSECVFVGYNNETTKQLNVYRPDLGYAVMSSVVDVDESKQGGSLDLQIRGPNAQGTPASQFTSQGTPSNLPARKPVGRPRKQEGFMLVDSIPEARNNFKIEIPIFKPPVLPIPPEADARDFPRPAGEIKTGSDKTDRTRTPDKVKANKPNMQTNNNVKDSHDSSTEKSPDAKPIREHSLEPETKDPGESNADLEMTDQPTVVDASLGTKRQGQDPYNTRAAKRLRAFIARQEAEIHALVTQCVQRLESDEEDAAFIAAGGTIEVTAPLTYERAIKDPTYGAAWKAAIEEEIRALVANNTWCEEQAPKGANLVSTKWVFTTKTDVHGVVERFKARLVARGFSQIFGEDYDQTFAPTVRTDTLRIFLAMVAAGNLECRQYDVKNAFTESFLKERIYLSPPKGVHVTPGLQLRVLRSLYGLKQSARDWNTLCKSVLKQLGFRQSLADPCLFTHPEKGITLLVYVDDIAAAAKDTTALHWFYDNFRKRFNTKDLGEISKLLGMRITRNRDKRELFVDQEQYLEKILNRIGLPLRSSSICKPRTTPVSGKYEKLEPAKDNEERADIGTYQRDVGSIMYAMIYTRPDIAFHIGRLSQQLTKPTARHQSAIKEIGRYLRSTIKQKIRYGPSKDKNGLTKRISRRVPDSDLLVLYSDADWANMKDCKSISGHVAMLYNGPVAYGSKKQRSVSTSSCEAEYIGMSTCCKQGQWIGQILRDMGFPEYIGKDANMVEMRADNQGAIALTKNPHLNERSKHIDISYHHIRDLEEQKRIKINYVPTTDMVADGFTKPLERVAFDKFKTMLGVTN
jgi:Reverse transcriptase (RNA-dependent DNA polymerase)